VKPKSSTKNEKADQFRATVQGGLDALYRVVRSDKANPDIRPSEPVQTEAPAETSRTEARPDVPAGSQPADDGNCDPSDSTCRGGLPVDAAAPQGMPDRDVAAPSTSPERKDDQPSQALDAGPSEAVPPSSSPIIESDTPTPVAPETPKKPAVKDVKPKSSTKN
jgi:hypothetical protein